MSQPVSRPLAVAIVSGVCAMQLASCGEPLPAESKTDKPHYTITLTNANTASISAPLTAAPAVATSTGDAGGFACATDASAPGDASATAALAWPATASGREVSSPIASTTSRR